MTKLHIRYDPALAFRKPRKRMTANGGDHVKKTSRVKANLSEPKSNQARILAFKCPICGSDTLAEVWHGVFESICIGGLVPGVGALVKGVEHDNGQAKFVGYYCANCWYALVNLDGREVKSEEDLVTFLETLSGDHETAEEYRRLKHVESSGPAPKYCADCGRQFERLEDRRM